LRGFAFTVPTAAPANVDKAVAEAEVLAAGPLRLHVDLSPVGTSQDAELARLLAAGARPADVGQRGDEGRRVLADPEGNEVCLLRRPLVT
jgi:glyoxalase superfamily protein